MNTIQQNNSDALLSTAIGEEQAVLKDELFNSSATNKATTLPATERDQVITKGSTWAAIWHMSWPLFLNMVTIAIASFADIWVAGQLGSDVQAAIGLGGQIWFFMVLLAVALSVGTNALVSRFWGEGNLEKTVEAARQSLVFAFFFGLASAIIGLIACRPFLRVLGASAEVERLGWDFLKFEMMAQLPFTILWVSNNIFRAKGNARVPMMIMAIMTTLVIALDLGLCIWPFRIGIAGIGMSWGLASLIGVTLSFFIMRKSEIGACLDPSKLLSGISKEGFWRLMKIGIPACVQDFSWVGGNFILFLIFAQTKDPTSCQASWAVGLKVEEMLGGFPIYALAMAAATIVGQNLGAKQPERAELVGWQVTIVGAAINTVIGAFLFFGANTLAHWMSKDPIVIKYAVQYLQVVGLCEPFVAIWIILVGAMNGAGYSRWPMWATVVCLTFIRLPLSWYLTVNQDLGPIGTWFSISVTSVAVGLLVTWRWRSGIWKLQNV